jgi:hypothetical protein
MSMKNSNDTIGNRTHDLPVCMAVPQPTAPPQWALLVDNCAVLAVKLKKIDAMFVVVFNV